MFIDVTRYGGTRQLRLAVAAIAYLDQVEGGCAVHLIGGESLRVCEDPADIEARVEAAFGPTEIFFDPDKETLEEMLAADPSRHVGPLIPAPAVDVKVNALPPRGKRK
jgi:hypothetical protein